jgi:hypothetical protein
LLHWFADYDSYRPAHILAFATCHYHLATHVPALPRVIQHDAHPAMPHADFCHLHLVTCRMIMHLYQCVVIIILTELIIILTELA